MTNTAKYSKLALDVASRARRDPAFRRDLLTDPRDTIEHEFDVHLPPDVEVRVSSTGNRTSDPLQVVLMADGEATRRDFGWTMLDRFVVRSASGAADRREHHAAA